MLGAAGRRKKRSLVGPWFFGPLWAWVVWAEVGAMGVRYCTSQALHAVALLVHLTGKVHDGLLCADSPQGLVNTQQIPEGCGIWYPYQAPGTPVNLLGSPGHSPRPAWKIGEVGGDPVVASRRGPGAAGCDQIAAVAT